MRRSSSGKRDSGSGGNASLGSSGGDAGGDAEAGAAAGGAAGGGVAAVSFDVDPEHATVSPISAAASTRSTFILRTPPEQVAAGALPSGSASVLPTRISRDSTIRP